KLKERHGYALLWDAHSIFSEVPRFFSGRLTELNLGTADGRSCGSGIGEGLMQKVSGYGAVLNGRFKGGYITRTYGDPAKGVHAVQLELSEATYMDEVPPFEFREDLARRLRPQLRALVEEFLQLGHGRSTGARRGHTQAPRARRPPTARGPRPFQARASHGSPPGRARAPRAASF